MVLFAEFVKNMLRKPNVYRGVLTAKKRSVLNSMDDFPEINSANIDFSPRELRCTSNGPTRIFPWSSDGYRSGLYSPIHPEIAQRSVSKLRA